MKKLSLYTAVIYCCYISSCSMLSEPINRSTNETKGVKQIAKLSKKKRDINYYAQAMTHDILSNISHVSPTSSIVTTSFIFIDGDYQASPVFARQLQESFNYEFHRIGQAVIEIKSTDYVRITPDGDLGLSTDFNDLKSIHLIDYILVGTLTQTIDGVQVNAKLVGTKSHAIVAAAQQFIPQSYIDTFISSKAQKPTLIKKVAPIKQAVKIKLIQGN